MKWRELWRKLRCLIGRHGNRVRVSPGIIHKDGTFRHIKSSVCWHCGRKWSEILKKE